MSWYQPAVETLGKRLYFAARDGVNGRELWSTDGSRAGTEMVADLCSGSCSSSPREMLATAVQLFFRTTRGLWVTDGTVEGTRELVSDCGSYCRPAMTLHRTLFFKFHDSEHGTELWSSDGTVEGTHLLADLCPGDCWGLDYYSTYFTKWRGELYFTGRDSPAGYGSLVRTDGTAAGTDLVLGESVSGHHHITHVVTFGNHLYFIGEGPTPDLGSRRNLFRSDGTPAGTSLVKDLRATSQGQLGAAGSRLFFRADYHELWTTNGTEEGTELLLSLPDGHGLANITRAGTKAFFAAYGSELGRELWSSDGTASGTRLVADVYREVGSSEPVQLAPFGDSVVFAADDDLEVPGIWRSDGTTAGTFALGLGPETSAGFYRDGDVLLFSSAEYWASEAGLWSTDGSAAGTYRIAPEVGAARNFTAVGDVLYMSAEQWDGEELWITDRSEEGTRQVKDICPEWLGVMPPGVPCSSAPHDLHAVGSGVLFAAGEEYKNEKLMWSDGTADGTLVLKDICPDDCSASPADIVRFGDWFYFAATDHEVGRELWVTDGTADATRRLLDLRPGAESSSPHHLTVWDDRIFLFAQGGTSGDELWSSDGTADGTGRVHELAVAGLPSFVTASALVGDRLFFVVVNESTGPELWASQGTEATTGMVREIHPGPTGAYPESLTPVDGVVVFRADDGVNGHELWTSDGTEEGTRLLADVVAGETSSYPTNLAATADFLFFQADDPEIGRELWALDRALVNPDWMPSADLAVTIAAAPDPVIAGELLTCTVTVVNAGPNPAPDVVVAATLGAGASLAGTSGCVEDPAGVPTCTCARGHGGDGLLLVLQPRQPGAGGEDPRRPAADRQVLGLLRRSVRRRV
ncbi:MAG: hypothetical protein GY856_53790, partial [bacterium]|nr:hypothetical protein [bacterium]